MNFPVPSPFGISMYFVRLFGAGCKTGILVGVAPAPALRPAGGVADGFEIDELEGLKNSKQNIIHHTIISITLVAQWRLV